MAVAAAAMIRVGERTFKSEEIFATPFGGPMGTEATINEKQEKNKSHANVKREIHAESKL